MLVFNARNAVAAASLGCRRPGETTVRGAGRVNHSAHHPSVMLHDYGAEPSDQDPNQLGGG